MAKQKESAKDVARRRQSLLKDCPQSVIEDVFGYPRKTLQIFKEDGMPHRKVGRGVRYDLCAVGHWLHDRYRGRGALDKHASSSSASAAVEEWQRTRADRAKFDFEVEQKQWENRVDVERRESDIAHATRRAFEKMGRELAQRLVAKASAQEVRRIIDDHVESRLKELSGRKV